VGQPINFPRFDDDLLRAPPRPLRFNDRAINGMIVPRRYDDPRPFIRPRNLYLQPLEPVIPPLVYPDLLSDSSLSLEDSMNLIRPMIGGRRNDGR